jgi:8-oxo-dGTP pyrophosphatase MutT (NUDIX family)
MSGLGPCDRVSFVARSLPMVQYRAGELNQDDDVEECERQAGRVVLLNDDNAVLLIEVVPASAAPFWLTPGGAVEPGETTREAAARELHEETGITVMPASLLGPLWRREHRFEWDGILIHQQEEFFLARHDGAVEAALNNVDSVEAATSRSLRWWSIEEVALADTERFVPASLAHHLRLLLVEGVRDEPHDVGA